MKYSLRSMMIVAMLGPPVLAMLLILSVGVYDFIGNPVPGQDGSKSSYDPVLPKLLWPVWLSLLVSWVVLGSIAGKRARQRTGEVIGALAGAALALLAAYAYMTANR